MPPAELLHSPQLGKQLRRLSEQFDLVLVDSAPVNLITDTQLLAGSCDAVLLVARAFSTTRKSLELAIQDLSQFRIIGTRIEWRASHASLPALQRILLTMINATGDAEDSQKYAAAGVASRVEIRELSGGEEAECDRFVMSSASGTFFHLSGWRSIVRKVLGHRCFCLVARRERGSRVYSRSAGCGIAVFGDCMVSLPLAVYGGICADDPDSYFEPAEEPAANWRSGLA